MIQIGIEYDAGSLGVLGRLPQTVMILVKRPNLDEVTARTINGCFDALSFEYVYELLPKVRQYDVHSETDNQG
jgi:hypothetical protein